MRGLWRTAPGGVALVVAVTACAGGDGSTLGEAGAVRRGSEGADAPGLTGDQTGPAWPGAVVELRGPEEVPGPGHPTARGRAEITLVAERNEVCVEIVVEGLDQPTAVHLHHSGEGQAGDVVLALPAPTSGDGEVKSCVSAAGTVIERLRAEPEQYYLNVHSEAHPDGALRGQLG